MAPEKDLVLRRKIALADELDLSDRDLLCLILVRLDDIEAREFSPSLHYGGPS